MKDIDIREELRNTTPSQFKYDSTTKIVEELGLSEGAFKIDIAVINGSLIGYEIKSEEDTLLYSYFFKFKNFLNAPSQQ